MKLTANQLILLLEIYRGTLDRAAKVGTRNTDIVLLSSVGLICVGPSSSFECTPNGNLICDRIKTIW